MISKRFKTFIEKNKIFAKNDKILVGCSGGADSILLAHLLLINKYNISIAHVNFNLRGKESNDEQIFVEKFASENNLQIFVKSFQTVDYAKEKKISIEMAARDLRYKWFNEILEKEKFDYIAVAHNQDDNIETFLINLSRKTGIRGLSGIKIKKGKIVRPLLFLSKDEIRSCLINRNIEFRNDSSNFENVYSRNKIRNIIIPEFEQINSGFRKNIIENIRINSEIEKIYFENIEKQKEECCFFENNLFKIDLKKLLKTSVPKTYLFEFLRDFNFNSETIADIIENKESESGKLFYSSTHKLLKDRNILIVREIEENIEKIEFYIEEDEKIIHINKNLTDEINFEISDFEISENFNINKQAAFGFFDYDKISFPLKLRKWKNSDRFMPLGMKNFKKLSDFFTDNKINIFEKERIWILESDNQIIWVVKYRIDNRFKISTKTKRVLKIAVF